MTTAAESGERTTPAKCSACSGPMDSPLVCVNCRQLYPAEGLNHFELLGQPARYEMDADALRRRYLELSREIHPDRFGARADATGLSMRLSAQVNEAYAVLANPLLRAEYLLELHGGPAATEDKRVPQQILTMSLMLREDIEDARAVGDAARLAAHQREIAGEFAAVKEQIAALAQQLPGSAETRAALREKLNTVKYFQRLLEQL